MAELLYSDVSEQYGVSEITELWHHTIASWSEFEDRVKKAASHSVFVDFVLGLAEPDLRTGKIFRILKRFNAKYIIVAAGEMPMETRSRTIADWFLVLIHKLCNNPRSVVSHCGRILVVFLRKRRLFYAVPEKIFCGSSDRVEPFIRRHRLPPGVIVPIHSLDHDHYVRYTKRLEGAKPVAQPTCVFLDEALTHHPDFALLGLRHLDPAQYFADMCRLFEVIERTTGFKVIIAAHPSSRYDEMPEVFGGRPIIKNATLDLVAHSSLVVAHYSTAISFAVLCRKPLVLTITSGMLERPESRMVELIAEVLGQPPIRTADTELAALVSAAMRGDPARYDRYLYKYIKSSKVGDLSVWDVVARELGA